MSQIKSPSRQGYMYILRPYFKIITQKVLNLPSSQMIENVQSERPTKSVFT